jgi:hypothetical protein
MSKLRPECYDSKEPALPDDTALYMIRDSIARRKALIRGRLHDGKGGHCAIGCFWTDNPRTTLRSSLIDEVAAINDSIPASATPQERWKKVNSWLRWKLRVLATARK